MRKIIITVLAINFLVIAIALVQDYFNNPVRGCKQFDASSGFTGYYCKDSTKYIAK